MLAIMYADKRPFKREKWPVYGHEWATRLLQRQTQSGQNGPLHAYLFTGPRHLGKSTLVTAFAQTLQCKEGGGAPCGNCRSCRLFQKQTHPDFRLVSPNNKEGEVDRTGGLLRVEQANQIIREVMTRPMEGRYKIFLIQDAHFANASFSNKLLKTLEEPPAHAILCLTSTDRSALLPTIVSRCQVLALRPLSVLAVKQALVNGWQADSSEADLLARLANGRLGWAVNQLERKGEVAERQSRLEMLWSLISARRDKRLTVAAELAGVQNERLRSELLTLWTSWWRDVMLTQAGCSDACTNVDVQQEIERQAENIAPDVVIDYLHTLQRIQSYLRHTINVRLAMDVLLLELPYTA